MVAASDRVLCHIVANEIRYIFAAAITQWGRQLGPGLRLSPIALLEFGEGKEGMLSGSTGHHCDDCSPNRRVVDRSYKAAVPLWLAAALFIVGGCVGIAVVAGILWLLHRDKSGDDMGQ